MGAFFSCKKQSGNIVIDGQGDGNRLGLVFTDTLSVQARTIKEDSLPGNNLTYSLLGALNDPIFGRSEVGIISQMSLLEPNSNFDNTVEPDSAILFIPIIAGLNFYGNQGDEQRINVFELQDALGKTTYYQKDQFATVSSSASTYKGPIFFGGLGDSIRYKNKKIFQPPALRIKLSTAMAKRLMSMPKEAYATNAGFQSNFKGLAIMADAGDLMGKMGGYGVFTMNTTDFGLEQRAKVLLYYKDTFTLAFGFDSKEKTINSTVTGPYSSNIQAQINNPGAYATTYVQGLSGLKSHVQLPWLNNLSAQGPISINKAQIVFYLDKTTTTESLFAPPRLNLFQPFGAGSVRNDLMQDAVDIGTGLLASIGGDYNESAGTYTFTITRQMQKWLLGYAKGENKNFGMYLTVPTGSPVLGARGVIDQSKTKVHIAYTKLN